MSAAFQIAQTADGRPVSLLLRMGNRHGLVTGATGTGKTVTLQVLAEQFSRAGVPSFLADVKGDLAGLSAAGALSDRLGRRLTTLKLPTPNWAANPVVFWDVFGRSGHPVRATISDMGPLLLARLLKLNETQTGVLTLVFKIADDGGLLLLDLRDLQAMLRFVGEHRARFTTEYGNISTASIGSIQRALLAFEQQGGEQLFGEPMLVIEDLISTGSDGRGVINVLAADRLLQAPAVYASLLLWLLSELFEQLDEVGDRDKPRLVFFFDEAHLLFDDAPDALVDRIEQVVRLIRSRGVGVYFVTQNPIDVPDKVLSQLGNRVQHALRAFTPRDQRAVRTAAETLRQNPAFDAEQAISELAVGEALVSTLDAAGAPTVVERAWVLAPGSRIGRIADDERRRVMAGSHLSGRYDQSIDRESAYERLTARAGGAVDVPASEPAGRTEAARKAEAPQGAESWTDLLFGRTGPRGGRREGILESAARSAARSIGSGIGRQILRGMLGSMQGGRRRSF